MNRWIGIGRWSKSVELRYTAAGRPVANASLAINEGSGDKRTVLFLDVVMWNKTAELTAQYCGDKGRLVAVEGRIQKRTYQAQDGSNRTVTEIVADNVRFLPDGTRQAQGEATNDFNTEEEPDF